MITSVIVPMGHGNRGEREGREKRMVKRSCDEAKQRKKNELREDRTITITQEKRRSENNHQFFITLGPSFIPA